MRPKPLLVVLLTLVLAAAACGGDDDEEETTPSVPETATVVLEPSALRVGDEELVFGEAGEDETVDALTEALGEAESEEELTECGEGPLRSVTFSSLVAYFQDDVLTGWRVLEDGPATLTTADGIGIGSTRAEVEEAFPEVTVEESSLGTEFYTGEGASLSGLLTDDTADGRVDEIWSGTTCIAR